MMQTYFDALFGKDLNTILDMLDENIEWLIVPTGDTLQGKAEIAKLAPNHPNHSRELRGASLLTACLARTANSFASASGPPEVRIIRSEGRRLR
jgi:hypothetical protein